MELVSVLMPCRNAAPWIGRALDSALRQTSCRIEVIVVDDGSTDGSHAIARTFASARCQVVRREPRGAGAARNHALSLAQGVYIQYLDADDLLGPGKVARQVMALHASGPRTLSWGSAQFLHEGSVNPGSRANVAPEPGASGAEFLARLWGGGGEPGMVAVHQWLTTRDLIERSGGWNEALSVDDDGEFFARIMLAAEQRLAVPDAWCTYRKFHHAGNLSGAARHDPRHRRSAINAACLKARYLLEAEDNERSRCAVSRLLTQQIIDAYPDPVHRAGLDFLRERGLELSRDLAAPPWFRAARPLVGWKAARLVQDLARRTRRLGIPLGRNNDAVRGSGRGVG